MVTCHGCEKIFKLITILKHISNPHKADCKLAYTEEEKGTTNTKRGKRNYKYKKTKKKLVIPRTVRASYARLKMATRILRI